MKHEPTLNIVGGDYVYVPVKGLNTAEVRWTVIDWLEGYDSQGWYTMGGHGVYFQFVKDAEWFTLRWG